MDNLNKEEKARRLMKEIMYANGCVNRWNPETYPEEHVEVISKVANTFFGLHPELYNNDDILNICDGCLDENTMMYGHLKGYKELNDALNDYFENL